MGSAASADIGFGIDLGESWAYTDDYEWRYDFIDEDADIDWGDLGEFLALQAGHKNPYESFPEGYTYETRDQFPEFEKATDDWYEIKQKLEDASPVAIDFYGASTYDWVNYVLILKDDAYRAHNYSGCTKLDALPEAPSQDEIEAAVKFCRDHQLPSFDSAGWLLYSDFG